MYRLIWIFIFSGLHFLRAQEVPSLLKEMKLRNIQGDTVAVRFSPQPCVILFSSENACSKCYENLEAFFSDHTDIAKMNLVNISRLPNAPSYRREFLKRYEIFDVCDASYFDMHSDFYHFTNDKCNDGIFGELKVCRTPAVCIITRDSAALFTHADLFDGMNVSKRFREFFLKVYQK